MVGEPYDFITGERIPSRNEQVSVIATSAQVSFSHPREVLVIRNTSPNVADIITIRLGEGAATSNNGIVLLQYESFTDSTDTGHKCWAGSVNAICATANGKLSIMEW